MKWQYFVLAVVAGFVGGLVATWVGPLVLAKGGLSEPEAGPLGTPAAVLAEGEVREVVRTKRVEVVDDEGEVRLVLGTSEFEEPELAFYDGQGVKRIELGMVKENEEEKGAVPKLGFYDEAQRPGVVLGVEGDRGHLS